MHRYLLLYIVRIYNTDSNLIFDLPFRYLPPGHKKPLVCIDFLGRKVKACLRQTAETRMVSLLRIFYFEGILPFEYILSGRMPIVYL